MLLPLSVLWPSPATPGAPRCGAVRACSPTDVPTVYTPFLESMFTIFAEYGIEFEPYPVAEELRQRSVTSGSAAKPRKVELSLQAHRSAKLRHIRAASIGKLVVVRGMITRCSDVKPHCDVCTYECDECGYEIYQETRGRAFNP